MNLSFFKTRWILILTGWIMFVMEDFFESFPSCLFFWLAGLYIIGNSLVFCMLVLSGDSFFLLIFQLPRELLATLYVLRLVTFIQHFKVPLSSLPSLLSHLVFFFRCVRI